MVRSICIPVALLSFSLFVVVNTQSGTTSSEPNVPTNEPIAGNYRGALRPQVHYSSPRGCMNDPNGMFLDAEGIYHLYYQYNPTAMVAGNQHWGHATSRDLFTWTNQPIALFPDKPGDGIFSGSAVVDVNNTSGFFPNQTNGVVAIYTLNTPKRQTQDIAYSFDNRYTFTKYANNPVIRSNSNQFRDPKVIWYRLTKRWIIVVAYSVDFAVGIFSSLNLINWTAESNSTHHGLPGLQYECPNLIEIPISGPLGSSVSQYFPGSFNGTHFQASDGATRLSDFAKDNYAAQFFFGLPTAQRPISIGWASNWQYANVVPTADEAFRSVMTVAHEHYLTPLPRTGLTLVSYPHNIFAAVQSELVYNSSIGNSTVFVDYSSVESGSLYWEANITGLTNASSLVGTLNFTVSSSSTGEHISGGTALVSGNSWGEVWLDRGHSSAWSNPFFTDKFSVTEWYDGSGAWRLTGIVDRSILEVFLNGGHEKATTLFYPTEPFNWMTISANGLNANTKVSVGIWGLRPAWLEQADTNGTVVGNLTRSVQ